MFWVGVAVTVYVLVTGAGVWPNVLTRAKPGRRAGPAPKLETIWFVDGPLAGRTDDLPAGPDCLVALPRNQGPVSDLNPDGSGLYFSHLALISSNLPLAVMALRPALILSRSSLLPFLTTMP